MRGSRTSVRFAVSDANPRHGATDFFTKIKIKSFSGRGGLGQCLGLGIISGLGSGWLVLDGVWDVDGGKA